MAGEIVHVTKAGTEVVRFHYPDGRRNVADVAQEQKMCYQLKLEHFTIRQISDMTGLSVGTVWNRINTEIDETVSPYRERYRVYERERDDHTARRILDLMAKPRWLFYKGERIEVDGEPVEDLEWQLHCLDRYIALRKVGAAREGTNAPDTPDAPANEVLPEDIELAALIRRARQKAQADQEALRSEG